MQELREDPFFRNKNDDAHEPVENRQLLDSHGTIPRITPAQALMTIQTITEHCQKWHDGSSNKNIDSSSSSEGIAAIEFPLNEEVKYGKCGRPFLNYNQNDERFNRRLTGYGSHDQPSSGEKKLSITKIINKHMEKAAKRHAEQDEWIFDDEKQETEESGMEEALATLETIPKIKQVPQEENQMYGKVCKMTRERILKDHEREKFRDKEYNIEENLKDPKDYREDKANAIMEAIHDKLNED
uniref:Uncharacterized protein n=1 Tax=Tanacetum cinerariifolium TaxID=118510 RepID=A0A6L2J7J3_TANCI|nr:hypothetical protein [Tanacetum cinerariifolium]